MKKRSAAKVPLPEGWPDFPCLKALSMREKVLPVLGTRLKERRYFPHSPHGIESRTASASPPDLRVGGSGHTQEAASPGH